MTAARGTRIGIAISVPSLKSPRGRLVRINRFAVCAVGWVPTPGGRMPMPKNPSPPVTGCGKVCRPSSSARSTPRQAVTAGASQAGRVCPQGRQRVLVQSHRGRCGCGLRVADACRECRDRVSSDAAIQRMREVAEQDRRPVVCVLSRSVEPRNRIAVSIPDQATAILDRLIATAVERHEVIVLTAVEIRVPTGPVGTRRSPEHPASPETARTSGTPRHRTSGQPGDLVTAGGDQDDSQCKGDGGQFRLSLHLLTGIQDEHDGGVDGEDVCA